MAEKNKVMIKIEADIKDLQSSLKKVEGSLKALEKSASGFDGIKKALGGIGGAVASAFAVDKMRDFVNEAVASASDLNSLNAQYEQVLGTMKGQADKYLNSISKKYNQHPNDLKQSFTMYQAMLKGKGVAEKDAFELAKLYMERTADASAFGNMSMAQSTEYFMAMIKGEYDSLDNAMIFTSQTMMNDTAQKEYGKKWEELTVTQQEYLKTSLAIKQHTDSGVLGQGSREAQEFGVVSERLKSTWNDLLAQFGHPIMEALTPKLQAIADSINTEKVKELATSFGEAVVKISDMIPKIVELADKYAPLISGILATIGTMKLMDASSKVMDNVKKKADLMKTTFTLLKANTNGLKGAFTILSSTLKLPIFNPVALGVGVAVASAVFLIKNWDKVKEVALKLWEGLKTVFGNIGSFISEKWSEVSAKTSEFFGKVGEVASKGMQFVFNAIKTHMQNVITFWSNIFNKAKEIVSTVFTTIGNVIQVALMTIAEIVRAGFMLVTLPIQFIWVNCKDTILSIMDAIGSGISNVISFIVNFVKTYLNMLFTFWKTVFTTAYNIVSNIFNSIKSVISTVVSFIVNAVKTYLTNLCNFWRTVFNTVFNIVSTVFNKIKTVISNILNAVFTVVSNIFNKIKTIISNVTKTIATVVSNAFNKIKSTITTITNAIKSVISNVWNGIRSVVSNVTDGIRSKISNAFEGIKTKVSSILGSLKNIVSNAWNGIKSIFDKVLKPNIKLPHIKISGKFSLNPPQVPKLGIDWYQTGGIFTGASVIGVGENGDEAVVPLSNKRRMKPFAEAVSSMIDAKSGGGETTANGVTINISQMVVREDADIKKIAEELNKLTLRTNRKKGLV